MDAFEKRGQSLEEAFFQERDRQLLAKLNSELETLEATKQLAHVSGITNEGVLANLVKAGVRAESLLACGLVPMIQVAWADGNIAEDERKVILKAATEDGIGAQTSCHQLLEQWLKTRPGKEMFELWKEYVAEIGKATPRETFQQLRDRCLERCRKVAGASGGVLGFGKTSPAESKVIEAVAAAFNP